MDVIDLHLAKKKMKIKKIDSSSVFLTTLWKGEVAMCIFDTVTSKLLQVNCFRTLGFRELEDLENVIIKCLSKK